MSSDNSAGKQSTGGSKNKPSKLTPRAACKRDALLLAELTYDIYKAEQANGNMTDGQNNAQQLSQD